MRLPKSHPSRVRGLKYHRVAALTPDGWVAPFTGAWIEIPSPTFCTSISTVAPFTGAWIEMIIRHKKR